MPDWDRKAKRIYKQLGKKFRLQSTRKINLKTVRQTIQYCSPEFEKRNKRVRDYTIKPKQGTSYSLVWRVDVAAKCYKVFQGYIIRKTKKRGGYKVDKYI